MKIVRGPYDYSFDGGKTLLTADQALEALAAAGSIRLGRGGEDWAPLGEDREEEPLPMPHEAYEAISPSRMPLEGLCWMVLYDDPRAPEARPWWRWW